MGSVGTGGKVAAGLIDLACTAGEARGIPRSELLYVAALEPEELADPDARLPGAALIDIVSHLLQRTGDRSLGVRFAEATDLRTQGFWGYLFLSCLSVRQAVELLLRFHSLRHPGHITFRAEDGWAIFEHTIPPELPAELAPIAGDAFLASFCLHRRRWAPEAPGQMHAWLTYAEEPHHRQLRELVGGPVTFEAASNGHKIPAWELDLPMRRADPHLLRLVEAQLEQKLADIALEDVPRDLADRVRSVLAARLPEGVSIERVARELRLSVRTLRRRLEETGLTFQRLLEEVRHRRAVEYLTKTEEAIERVAERLGYGDSSNFRRAFRRWTGVAPATFRAEHAASLRTRGAARASTRAQARARS